MTLAEEEAVAVVVVVVGAVVEAVVVGAGVQSRQTWRVRQCRSLAPGKYQSRAAPWG